MKYDFIEIGTCDYDTLLQQCQDHEIGLSIEPIKMYQDRLPNRPNVIKVNAAITDEDKQVDLFYVTLESQDKYGLNFTRGWGTIITPSKGHSDPNMMLETGMLTKSSVEGITWNTLVSRYDINSVDFVKIDAEGHDCIIVQSIAASKVYPKKIQFEVTPYGADRVCVESAILSLQVIGYKLISDGEDMVWEL